MKSISDDDLCSACMHCTYRPGELSACSADFPAAPDVDGYITLCGHFGAAVASQEKTEPSKELTLAALTAAIRSAESLEELYRLIGPSEEENQKARARLKLLETVSEKCEWDKATIGLDAYKARDRYNQIMEEQAAYESRYL